MSSTTVDIVEPFVESKSKVSSVDDDSDSNEDIADEKKESSATDEDSKIQEISVVGCLSSVTSSVSDDVGCTEIDPAPSLLTVDSELDASPSSALDLLDVTTPLVPAVGVDELVGPIDVTAKLDGTLDCICACPKSVSDDVGCAKLDPAPSLLTIGLVVSP